MTCTGTEPAVVVNGYVRLSRDDNRRNYTSIENQKKIIFQYAREHSMTVGRIYEDDGFSGYSFSRPAFQQMMADLDSIGVIVAKDLSRIGRHNAKVLLFLEEMEELGKRVILIDDGYDSLRCDDDMIGIKTWDNERYVKSTSRKVRRIKRMEQENGTLKTRPPFGYTRHPLQPSLLLIDQEAAAILNLEKELYLEGNGIRKVAELLTERGVPTPSTLRQERRQALGLPCGRPAARQWTYSMVKDTLFNDFHNGVLRTHKRERVTINGKDRKVPKDQQYVFPDHHPKIFDDDAWRLLLEVKESRSHSRYRGQRTHVNLFSGCLFCKDCGLRMTAVSRPGRPKYYVCGTYNKKGKRFCPHSHLVTEEILTKSLFFYLSLWRRLQKNALQSLDLPESNEGAYSLHDSRKRLENQLEQAKRELKTLIAQKVRELAEHPRGSELIAQSYQALQEEKTAAIFAMERQLANLGKVSLPPETAQAHGRRTALTVLDEILKKRELTRTDVEMLVEKMVVDRDGNVEIYLRHWLDGLEKYSEKEMSRPGLRELPAEGLREGYFQTEEDPVEGSGTAIPPGRLAADRPGRGSVIFPDPSASKRSILIAVIRLLETNRTGFTSVRALTAGLNAMGIPIYRKKLLPFMEILQKLRLTEETGNHRRPYRITASRQTLEHMEKMFLMAGRPGGMPQMVFEYILKKNGIDPKTDLSIDQSISFGLTAAAFPGSGADYTVEFEPFATALEQEGQGYVVASLGVDSGYVPYTAYSAKKTYMEEHPDVIQQFTNAIQKGLEYVNSHSAEEIAETISPQFPETDVSTLATIVNRYKEQDTWKEDTVFTEESFDLLLNILEEAGELKERVPYEELVTVEFAEKAK